jgi:hypothetical protein
MGGMRCVIIQYRGTRRAARVDNRGIGEIGGDSYGETKLLAAYQAAAVGTPLPLI